ncbi:hypothetical protein CDAR_188161 [Caerostris darwini]|uniref:Uncharacterized protein n=1 Tax=Caerostris darwini TaxID=1538125 RepID=A0AAV4NQY0_9ARAC|nr:hypothetical protein CDAR_503561 [Caerostris darwini]GIX88375.1 hypothetical protein CDAR_188161 [Caerostris darwini]
MPGSERKQNSLRHSPITIYWFSRLSWRLINAAQTDIQDSDKKKKVAKQKAREVVGKEKKKNIVYSFLWLGQQTILTSPGASAIYVSCLVFVPLCRGL